MSVSYRTKRRMQSFGIFLMLSILVMIFVWMVWLLWLDRYVIYGSDGAKLDFSLSYENFTGEVATPPVKETIPIHFNEGDEEIVTVTPELIQMLLI